MEFQINDTTYEVIDFNNQFSLKQQGLFKKVMKKVFDAFEIGNETKFDLTALMDASIEADVLALISVPKGEKFNEKDYPARVELFENELNYTEELKEVFTNFLNSKGKSVIEDSLTYLKAMGVKATS